MEEKKKRPRQDKDIDNEMQIPKKKGRTNSANKKRKTR